ncbi:MAG: hypothetical protein J7497_01665, partial [Chitinophagaceae bacterium]|nr:hypothetical protein [Chitinophagaceae bacterium]
IKTIDPVKAESPANTIAVEPIKEQQPIQHPVNDIVEIKKTGTKVINIAKQTKPHIPAVEPVIAPPVAEIKPSLPANTETASIKDPKENVVTTISPQDTYKELNKENDIIAAHQVSAPEYGPSTENDMIYLANTSVSKRNKLRGVFRKATRFIDKVTSNE